MNKFNFIKNALFAAVALVTITACVQDDDYSTPPIVCNNRWDANATIADIKALNDTDTPFEMTAGTYFDGYVVSSDETGNFFKTISVQNALENPTAGLQIEMDITNLYTRFPVGSRVIVDVNGLYEAKDRGTYKVGTTFDSNGTLRVGRMPEDIALDHVALSCDEVMDIVPTTFTTITDALSEDNLNTLIKLENVQFQTAGNGETYYDEENAFGGATNVTVTDSQGNTIVLRTSSFADFAADVLPDGSGSLTAVLSAYSSSNNVTPSTYQMFIRSTADVQFDQPRFEVVNGEGPIGGGDASYTGCISEDFESYGASLVSFNNYINYAYNGSRYWEVKEFGDNKYIQMGAFNSDEVNEVFFVVPVNFDEADTFSFKSKDGFNNGDALTVHYTTDDVIANGFTTANLVDITSEFTLATGTASGYASTYTESGEYSLSSISGNGAIVFKYTGADGGITTTFQIDDVMVVDNENTDCGSSGGGGGDATSIFTDSFEDLSNWTAVSVTGDQAWEIANFGNPAPSAKISGYANSQANENEDWLISNPIAVSTGVTSVTFTFDNVKRYGGNDLEAYYTTNYTGDVATTSWSQLTPTLDTDEGSWDSWTSSGDLDVSSAIGSNLVVAFKYTSTSSDAATFEIDNVNVVVAD